MPDNTDRDMYRSDSGLSGLVLVFFHLAFRMMALGPCSVGPITVGRLVMDFLPAKEGFDVLPLGPIRDGGHITDFFRPYLSDAEREHDWYPRDPGLRAAAMMMGFVRNSMDIWFHLEARQMARNSNHVQHIGNVEYRLAGRPQRFGEVGRTWV